MTTEQQGKRAKMPPLKRDSKRGTSAKSKTTGTVKASKVAVGESGRSAFGSVRILPSGRWQARFKENRVWKVPLKGVTYATEEEGWEALENYRVDKRRGVLPAVAPSEEPLADFAWRWHAVHTARKPPGTKVDYRNVIRNGITRPGTPLYGVTVAAPDEMLVQEWLNVLHTTWVDEKGKQHPGYGPANRVKAFRILSMVMKAAEKAKLRPKGTNPCDDITPATRAEKAQARRPHHFLYLREVARLIAAADYIDQRDHEDWGLFFEIVAWGGLRPQEVRALWPSQVHRDAGFIMVDAAISDGENKAATKRESTKAGRTRLAHLPSPVMERLAERIDTRGIAFLSALGGEEQLIFPAEDGRSFLWPSTYLNQGWKPMVGVAGIEPDPGSLVPGRRLTPVPYDLRAFHVTQLLSAGVPQVDVRAQVGHHDQETTDLYTMLVAAGLEDPIAVAARKEADMTRKGALEYMYAEAQKTLGP